jgi:hypothetical protein
LLEIEVKDAPPIKKTEVIPRKTKAKKIPPKAGNMNAFILGLELHKTSSFGSKILSIPDKTISLMIYYVFFQ